MDSLSADKALLRETSRTLRRSIPAEERPALSEAATVRALELPEVQSATHVLGFVAMPEELDPSPLLNELRRRGATICLPRVDAPGTLELHSCTVDTGLEEGPHGVLQPPPHAPLAEFDTIDLVIVPGVAFDNRGARLGMGGGYYDRLLARMHLAHRVAFVFDDQLVELIPEDPHDQRVDAVITPLRTLICRRSR